MIDFEWYKINDWFGLIKAKKKNQFNWFDMDLGGHWIINLVLTHLGVPPRVGYSVSYDVFFLCDSLLWLLVTLFLFCLLFFFIRHIVLVALFSFVSVSCVGCGSFVSVSETWSSVLVQCGCVSGLWSGSGNCPNEVLTSGYFLHIFFMHICI